jgi:hypothetical protein
MYSLGWSSPRGNQMEYSRVHMMNPRDHPRQNGKIPSSQCIIVSCILNKESNMNQIYYIISMTFSTLFIACHIRKYATPPILSRLPGTHLI